MESNLVHLEEYVDTIISLPHEIQRNLTMIREHDAKVQEEEKDLFVYINDFMGLQSGEKSEISEEKRIELIQRIKNSFLSTLTHCEEKVSLSDQCYNLVEKHLIKMEDDLKCFEEEIRLSGYSDLLEKVQMERKKQREQVRNKKRQEASLTNEDESEEEVEEAEREESSSEKEQQQQQQQKKRKTSNNRTASNPPKKQAREPKKTTSESDDEAQMTKISRAERLLRRSKPNYVDGKESDERGKEDLIENQGDDEAEEADESEERSEESEVESEVKEDPLAEEEEKEQGPAIQNLLTINSSRNNTSSGASSGDDSQTTSSSKSSKRRQSKPSEKETFCTCNRGSFGEMIGCDAKDCPVEWFHYECVGLKSPPKGKWYCRECQEAMDAKTAAQLSIGIGTRSTRRS